MANRDSFAHPAPFTFQPRDWPAWKKRFEHYHQLTKLDKESHAFQISALLYSMGDKSDEVLATLKFTTEADRKKYDEVMKALDAHFVGKRNVVYERAMFGSRCQRDGETIEELVRDLHKMSEHCDYKDLREELVRDRLVLGVRDKKLSEKLMLMDALTLEKAVEVSRQWEAVKRESAELTGANNLSEEVDRVHQQSAKSWKRNGKFQTKYNREPAAEEQAKISTCWNCGLEGHISRNKEKCPAVKSTCEKCHKTGHYARCCRSREVKEVVIPDTNNVNYLLQISHETRNKRKTRWQAEITVDDKVLEFKLDPGADVTVIPYVQWKKTFPNKTLTRTNVQLRGANGDLLDTTGTFVAVLRHKQAIKREEIFVVKRAGAALLGLDACEDLALVARVGEIEQSHTTVRAIQEFPTLFTGLGKMKQEYAIQLKPNSVPYAVHTPRRVPLPLMNKLKAELEDMVRKGVIEPIEEPTPWCAPMVLNGKPNGSIRICVDLQKLNQSVERELHMLPMVEHELGKLDGAKIFSKLDANSGFWQIPLSRDTAKLTTFITPFGRYYFKRLPFGISSAPEHFQKRMSNILRGQNGAVCLMDDILVFGSTREEHDTRLRDVLSKLQDSGVSLNQAKCQFGLKKVRFLGHIIDENGIHPDDEKVKAVMQMGEPKTVAEVRQILGHLNYLANIIPNMSTKLRPLNSLLKTDTAWTWGQPQQTAFEEVKKILSSDPVLAKYDTKKQTIVSADASSFGIGAVLKQKQDDGSWRPVSYASRTLTDAEKRYAQIEKEALGITWACDRFRDFIIGMNFLVETDHKPLLAIFKTKELGELSPRLQRFRMRMMHFSFKIFHTPGKDLLATDFLSRHPLDNQSPYDMESEVKEHVQFIVANVEISDERLQSIAVSQQKDGTLQKVMQYLVEGWPEKADLQENLKPYHEVRSELSNANGLLIRDSRLVIPYGLRKEILYRLHEGHFGINKCRARARCCVWWPGLSTEIEEMIRSCEVCAQERPAKHQPLIPSEFPERPWQKVGMDLFHYDGKWHLVVCDFYSRYPEVVSLANMTGELVIRHLKAIFARHGVPEQVYSDNGTQFSPNASSLFKEFAKEYGFQHKTSSPKFPQSNGFAEGAVKIVKNAMKKNKDIHKALLEYRATPLANGYSPAQLLFGRRLRTVLPCPSHMLTPYPVNPTRLRNAEENRRENQKRNFDRRHGAKERNGFSIGERVWMRDRREWGVVVQLADSPRSYWVKTETGTFRRNAYHMESIGKAETEEFDIDIGFETETVNNHRNEETQEGIREREQPEPEAENRSRSHSRFGREYKPVDRFKS